jgi:hypothetical protein
MSTVDDILPTGGPYTPDQIHTAAAAIAELARRLNHATLAHHVGDTLPTPGDVDLVLTSIAALTARLPQLIGQLADTLSRYNPDRLAVDQIGPATTGPDAARHAMFILTDAAQAANALADLLADARHYTRRLTYQDPT